MAYGQSVDRVVPVQGSGGGNAVTGGRVMYACEYSVAPRNADTDGICTAITLIATGQSIYTPTVENAATLAACPQLVTVTGVPADTALTGNVVIYGTDICGKSITDTIALNGSATVSGVYAFKTVTRVNVPARNASGDTVTIGFTKAIGVPWRVSIADRWLEHTFDGSSDAGAWTYDATYTGKNVYTPAGTPNGSKIVTLVALV